MILQRANAALEAELTGSLIPDVERRRDELQMLKERLENARSYPSPGCLRGGDLRRRGACARRPVRELRRLSARSTSCCSTVGRRGGS